MMLSSRCFLMKEQWCVSQVWLNCVGRRFWQHFDRHHSVPIEISLNFQWQKILYLKKYIWTRHLLCKRLRCYHSTSKTQVAERIFKLKWFIRFLEFAEFTEFLIHLGKTPMTGCIDGRSDHVNLIIAIKDYAIFVLQLLYWDSHVPVFRPTTTQETDVEVNFIVA